MSNQTGNNVVSDIDNLISMISEFESGETSAFIVPSHNVALQQQSSQSNQSNGYIHIYIYSLPTYILQSHPRNFLKFLIFFSNTLF